MLTVQDLGSGATPDLLIEVPHGATQRAHYDALAERLHSELPADLHAFFHMNTDVGSWSLAQEVGRAVVAARPGRSVRLVRCLVPRTFIDVNRTLDAVAGDLRHGGVTAALGPWIRHPDDRALLVELHRAYTSRVSEELDATCGSGGLALIPHTYGPVSVGISGVDDDIVEKLREAHRPEVYAQWPLRAQVDLITADEEGRTLAPPGMAEALVEAYRERDVAAVIGGTYFLHPSTAGRTWSERYPGQVLCLEVRRDLLVRDWRWSEPMEVVDDKVARMAAPLAEALDGALVERGR